MPAIMDFASPDGADHDVNVMIDKACAADRKSGAGRATIDQIWYRMDTEAGGTGLQADL
jgi:hypothetical protein